MPFLLPATPMQLRLSAPAATYHDKRPAARLSEVRLRGKTLIVIVWLVIGALAAGQRGEYNATSTCNTVATIGVTIASGLLNYLGVDPRIDCQLPEPSK